LKDKQMSIAMNTKMKIKLKLDMDSEGISPFDENDLWKFVTFRMDSMYDVKADEWTLESEGLTTADLDVKYWPVSCYRHSGAHWFLQQDNKNSCPWDTRRLAGYIILLQTEGKYEIPKENRLKAARGMIESFDAWARGDCWWYALTYDQKLPVDPHSTLHGCPSCKCGPALAEIEEQEYDSCGGFIGEEDTVESVCQSFAALHLSGNVKPETHEIVLSVPKYLFVSTSELTERLKNMGYDVQLDEYRTNY